MDMVRLIRNNKSVMKMLRNLLKSSEKGFTPFNSHEGGFTLVELLIVIAILGVLAAVVLVAINPIEQINRANDSGRISSVGQLGNAVLNYQTSQQLPDFSTLNVAAWQTTLVTANEIKNPIVVNAVAPNCTTNNPNNATGNVCFGITAGTPTQAVVWTVLNSQNSKSRASCGVGVNPPIPVAVWDSTQGKAGIGCVATAVAQPAAGIKLY